MQQTCNRSQSPVTSSSIDWICCTLPSVDSGRLRNQDSRRRPEENSSQGLEDSPRWRLLVLVAHWRICRVATRVVSQLRELRLAAASMKHQEGATGSSRTCETYSSQLRAKHENQRGATGTWRSCERSARSCDQDAFLANQLVTNLSFSRLGC